MIILDIETAPEKKEDMGEWQKKWREDKWALNPFTGKVIWVGAKWFKRCDEICWGVKHSDTYEEELIRVVCAALNDYRDAGETIVTYNGSGFDIPFLAVRAWKYGLRMPTIPTSRWKVGGIPEVLSNFKNIADIKRRLHHWDLIQTVTFNQSLKLIGLDDTTEFFGLNKDRAHSGAEIPELYEKGDWDGIAEHNAGCLRLIENLAMRFLT